MFGATPCSNALRSGVFNATQHGVFNATQHGVFNATQHATHHPNAFRRKLRFLANVDPVDVAKALNGLNPGGCLRPNCKGAI